MRRIKTQPTILLILTSGRLLDSPRVYAVACRGLLRLLRVRLSLPCALFLSYSHHLLDPQS